MTSKNIAKILVIWFIALALMNLIWRFCRTEEADGPWVRVEFPSHYFELTNARLSTWVVVPGTKPDVWAEYLVDEVLGTNVRFKVICTMDRQEKETNVFAYVFVYDAGRPSRLVYISTMPVELQHTDAQDYLVDLNEIGRGHGVIFLRRKDVAPLEKDGAQAEGGLLRDSE